MLLSCSLFFFFKQKTAYEMRISDWSSDVCSSDLIYLDPRLFYEDQKPAVDVGKSVSRVGGKTQAPALKALAESLRLEYAQFLELEVFTRFGTMVDERTRKTIEHGRRIRAVLGQRQFSPSSLGAQVALLLSLAEGPLDGVQLDRIDAIRAALGSLLAANA